MEERESRREELLGEVGDRGMQYREPERKVRPVVAKAMKHTTELLLIAICVYLIVEIAGHQEQFSPPQCQSRAILVLNISGAFLACLISLIDIVMACRVKT